MGEWEFYRIPGGLDDPPFLWSWRCCRGDGSIHSTPDTFRFFLDCVAHARLHGYAGGPLQTRRETPRSARRAVSTAPIRATASVR